MRPETMFAAIVAGIVCSLLGVPRVMHAQHPASSRVRIGTYDPRAIAVAYAGSDLCQDELKQKKQELKDAEAKKDAKRVNELKSWGESQQWLLHLQGFAAAPVDNILLKVNDRLPGVAEAAAVDVIARKTDYIARDVETVDVTEELVRLFNPSEKALQRIRDLRSRPPMNLIEVENALKTKRP